MASREHFIALLLAPCADFLSDGFDGDHEARDTFVMAAIGASGADARVQPVQAQQQSAFEAAVATPRNTPCSRAVDGPVAVNAGPGHDAFPDIHVTSYAKHAGRVTRPAANPPETSAVPEGRHS